MAIGANVRHCARMFAQGYGRMLPCLVRIKPQSRSVVARPLGAAGLSLALTSGAHAATDGTSADRPTLNTLVSQEITLAEEEISDVSLSTFYVFDKENQRPQLGRQL